MDLHHCSILEFGREASNQAVTLGITRPRHATEQKRAVTQDNVNINNCCKASRWFCRQYLTFCYFL